MKFMKCFAMLCASIIMMSVSFSIRASAADLCCNYESEADTNETRAEGLIVSFYLSMATASKQVQISASTRGYETMAKIGFKDITVQRSTNGSTNWTDEVYVGNNIISDDVIHSLNHFPVSVTGGYYYRIMLTHYAKETGWFFPSSQSITNYSNVLWVPAS